MNIIEGIQFDVPAAELRAHLDDRIAFHDEKAKVYERQHDDVAQTMRDEDMRGQTVDPRQSLAQQARSHQQRAALFRFMAAHVINDALYRLDESDLARLELMDRW